MSITFPFVLLRAVADAPRCESLNIGLVAWPTPGKPVVRLQADAARLRAVHPNLARMDWQGWAQQLQEALMAASDTAAQLTLLALAAAPLRADAQAGTASAEPGAEMDAIEELMARLVATPAATLQRPASRRRTSRMAVEIRDWLKRAKLYSARVEDMSRGRVVGQFPVDAASDLYADFALRNGAVHIMETFDLREVDRLTPALRGEAALKGITLDEAKSRLPGGKRIALVQASDYGVARPAFNLLERYADEMWNLGNTTDRQSFARFVSGALHVEQLPGF